MMVNQGHTIGNHTYHHNNIHVMTATEVKEQIKLTDELVKSVIGEGTVYFLPPRGYFSQLNRHTLQETAKTSVFWDLCLEKSGCTDPDELVKRLLRRAGNKGELVLLLHDGNLDGNDRTASVEALPLLIEELLTRGYRFIDPASEEGRQFILSFAAGKQEHH